MLRASQVGRDMPVGLLLAGWRDQWMKLYLSSFLIGNQKHQLTSLCQGRRAVVVANALDNLSEARMARLAGQQRELRELGFSTEELDLRYYFDEPDSLVKRLDTVDLVWVTGGNAFLLRRAMRQSGFDDCILARKHDDSLVYGGYSAGICVAGTSLRGLHLVDDANATAEGYSSGTLWDGLRLVPYCLAPHYKSDHPESSRIEQVVQFFTRNEIPFVALQDGEVLIEDAS